MIDVRQRVLPGDFLQAAQEAHCISECINVAAAGMAMDDLNMVRDRLKDAMKSMNELDRLMQYKRDNELAEAVIGHQKVCKFWEDVKRRNLIG